MNRWKKRNDIRQLNIAGEKLSADSKTVFDFTKQFREIIEEGYVADQIYNCDESDTNFKMSSKKLVSKEESTDSEYKSSKERITVLLCGNVSGDHKLPLMCVGKSAKAKSFRKY